MEKREVEVSLSLDTFAPLLGAIRRTALIVTPKHRVSVSPDEPDNRFLFTGRLIFLLFLPWAVD